MSVINVTASVVLDTYNACYAGAALSIASGLFIVYTYLTVPALRVQPNVVLVAKAVFDMLLGVMIAIEYVPFVNATTESDLTQWRDCGGDFYNPVTGAQEHNDHSWAATFLTQWFFTLSLLCFGIIALDFMINSTNPFANMRKNNVKYGVGVFLLSLVPPTVMVVRIDGKTGAGRWILGFCFTKWSADVGLNHTLAGQSYNWRIWAVNIAVIIVMLLFSMAVSAFFCNQNRLKAKARGKIYGEEDRFTDEVLRMTMNCVVAFLVYWLINAGLYMALFVSVEGAGPGSSITTVSTTIASVFAFVFSAQGFVLLPFWFRGSCRAREGVSSTNVLAIRRQLGNAMTCRCARNFVKGEQFETAPSTNSALRKEIVTYLSRGIQLLKHPPAEFAETDAIDKKNRTYVKIRLLITDGVHTDDDNTDHASGLVSGESARSPASAHSPLGPKPRSPSAGGVTLVQRRSHERLDDTAVCDLDALPVRERVVPTRADAGSGAGPTRRLAGEGKEPEEGLGETGDVEAGGGGSGGGVGRGGGARNNGNVHYIKLNRRGGCTVTEMWPTQMALVREKMFKDPDVYHRSLKSISAAKLSGGKSEAFMFKTDDKRFVLKTMSGTEFKQLSRMMMVPRNRRRNTPQAVGNNGGEDEVDLEATGNTPLNPGDVDGGSGGEESRLRANRRPFWQFMIDQPSSFIVKIFGVYKMTLSRFGSLNDGVRQYFIVMQNVFYDSDTSVQSLDLIQETYDLKGSTVARSASPLKDGTPAICRFCRNEFTVGAKNVPTPQPGDFVQLCSDYHRRRARADESDEFGICTGILQRQHPDGTWRVRWPRKRSGQETHSAAGRGGGDGAGTPGGSRANPGHVRGARTHSVHTLAELCWTDGTQLQETTQATAKCKVSRRHEPVQVFKDNDLKYKVVVSPRKKFSIGDQLRVDSAFLARHNVMDYSLLLGVHRSQFLRTRASKWPVPLVRMPDLRHAPYLGSHAQAHGGAEWQSSASTATTSTASPDSVWGYREPSHSMHTTETLELSQSVGVLNGRAAAQLLEGPNKFYFGIIDILQHWNMQKKTERCFKKMLCCAAGKALSASEPRPYKHRFDRFMNEQVFDTANSKANVVLQSDDQAFAWVIEVPPSVVHVEPVECTRQVSRFARAHAAKECDVSLDSVLLDEGSVDACVSSLVSGHFLNEIPIVTFRYRGQAEGGGGGGGGGVEGGRGGQTISLGRC